MQYYAVGMDGGGTKTNVEARAEDGRVLLRAAFGSMNLNSASEQTVAETFRACAAALRALPGGLAGCRAVCIGSAGVSNPDACRTLERLLRGCGYDGPLLLRGDQETALAGALGRPDGMVLIAGTGSICFGRDAAGRTARCGGYGHKIDDEGSGYALGRDALAAVVRAGDGRIPPTMLTRLVYERLGIADVRGLVRFTYAPETDKKEIAALAPLVSEAAAAGDAAAGQIVEKACRELAALVMPVAGTLRFEAGQLALAGSILLHVEAVRAGVTARLRERYPQLKCVAPREDAASGAALLAWEAARQQAS